MYRMMSNVIHRRLRVREGGGLFRRISSIVLIFGKAEIERLECRSQLLSSHTDSGLDVAGRCIYYLIAK